MFEDEEDWIKDEIEAALADLPNEDELQASPFSSISDTYSEDESAVPIEPNDTGGHFKYDYRVHFDGIGDTAAKWALPAFQEFVNYAQGEEERCNELEEVNLSIHCFTMPTHGSGIHS